MMFKRRIADSATGPTTYVAPGTTFQGTLTGHGRFVFCGTVEGDCDIDGPVTLAENAVWKGTLCATDVIVAGHVEGDVIARQKLEIAGTARVQGSLSGHSIAVASGAVIDGELKVASGGTPHVFEEKRRGE